MRVLASRFHSSYTSQWNLHSCFAGSNVERSIISSSTVRSCKVHLKCSAYKHFNCCRNRISYISVSGVTPYVVAKNDTHISVGIAWTVNSGDSKQVICFNATDSLGYVLMHCTNFNVYMYTLIDMKPNTLTFYYTYICRSVQGSAY